MTYWVAWYADFPLSDDEGRIILFSSAQAALNYARPNWPSEYLEARECVMSCNPSISMTSENCAHEWKKLPNILFEVCVLCAEERRLPSNWDVGRVTNA